MIFLHFEYAALISQSYAFSQVSFYLALECFGISALDCKFISFPTISQLHIYYSISLHNFYSEVVSCVVFVYNVRCAYCN